MPRKPSKPSVAIIGANRGKDVTRMHDELDSYFKLRVITSVQQVRNLRDFDGPIILWTRWISHDLSYALKQINVKFVSFSGSLSSLISYVRTEYKA